MVSTTQIAHFLTFLAREHNSFTKWPKRGQNDPFLTIFDPLDKDFHVQPQDFFICMDVTHHSEHFLHLQLASNPHPALGIREFVPNLRGLWPKPGQNGPKRAKICNF
jgi:hypothetical protein